MKIFCLTLLMNALSGITWAVLDLKQLCFDKRLNAVVAHPEDCRGYIQCTREQPSEHYCDVGFHFDVERLICDWPENANCQLDLQSVGDTKDSIKPVYTTLKALDIMTGEVIDPMISYDPLNVVCRHFGAYFLPNPKQCRSYYLCAYGHIHEHACGPNTLWDYKAQQCVLNHKAVCFHLNEKEQHEISESLDQQKLQNIPVICYPVHTTTTTTTTRRWNETTSAVLPTTPIPPLPPSTSSKEPNLNNPYHIVCPTRRQSYVAHPEDCNKYFMCILGTPIMTSCPEGLLWDSKKEYCDSRNNVKCFPENTL